MRRLFLIVLLVAAGVGHFVSPSSYESIVPRAIGHAHRLVQISGLAELACAALLAVPRTRRLGGWAALILFIAVFPANGQAALDGGMKGLPAPLDSAAAAWLRLPLQIPLVLLAAREARQQA